MISDDNIIKVLSLKKDLNKALVASIEKKFFSIGATKKVNIKSLIKDIVYQAGVNSNLKDNDSKDRLDRYISYGTFTYKDIVNATNSEFVREVVAKISKDNFNTQLIDDDFILASVIVHKEYQILIKSLINFKGFNSMNKDSKATLKEWYNLFYNVKIDLMDSVAEYNNISNSIINEAKSNNDYSELLVDIDDLFKREVN